MNKQYDSKTIGTKEMVYQLFSGLLWWQLEWVGPAYTLVKEKRPLEAVVRYAVWSWKPNQLVLQHLNFHRFQNTIT